jgi:hypothetical protein
MKQDAMGWVCRSCGEMRCKLNFNQKVRKKRPFGKCRPVGDDIIKVDAKEATFNGVE